VLAVPLATVDRRPGAVEALVGLVREHGAIEVLVGLPLSLDGTEGPAAAEARGFARELAGVLEPPVRLVDERLSTVTAQRGLHAAGRSTRTSRGVIDQAAAVVILEQALDTERTTGEPPGEVVPAGGGVP